MIVLANKADVANKKEGNANNDEYNDEDDDQEREIEVTDEDIANFEQTHNLKVLKNGKTIKKEKEQKFEMQLMRELNT